MRIFFVRNSEHLGEKKGLWAGPEVGLSDGGRRQAEALCVRLLREHPDAIYSSDFLRATETIKPLAARIGLEVVKLSALRAFDPGVFLGKTYEETAECLGKHVWREIITNPNPSKRYFDGGETLQEAAERAWTGLLAVVDKHSPEERIVISTHLTIIGCVLCRMLSVPLNKLWFWGGGIVAEHPSITTVAYENERWCLMHYGCTEHLVSL